MSMNSKKQAGEDRNYLHHTEVSRRLVQIGTGLADQLAADTPFPWKAETLVEMGKTIKEKTIKALPHYSPDNAEAIMKITFSAFLQRSIQLRSLFQSPLGQ